MRTQEKTILPRLNLFPDSPWIQVRDGDPAGQVLFNRHYSKYVYADGRNPKLFVGPGEKMVLITANGKALFVWRKYIDDSHQIGVNCAIFRNENSGYLASDLILMAEKLAHKRWPGARFYTYIDPKRVKGTNPGYCFKMAGWKQCGITKKRKFIILEKNG